MNQEFTLYLGSAPNDEQIDLLYEAGCDDGSIMISTVPGESIIMFNREADTMQVAVASAVKQVESVGIAVTRAEIDLETLREVKA